MQGLGSVAILAATKCSGARDKGSARTSGWGERRPGKGPVDLFSREPAKRRGCEAF